MSLLTTFGILFETDAEKAKREVDEVDKSLSNAESTANDAADSFDELGDVVDESADSFFGLSEGLVTAAAGLLVVTGLFAGLTSQALATDEIGKFSNAIGVNVEDVGAWGEAVKRAGGDVNSFMGSLGSLTDQLTDISLTGGGEASEIFARLGVDAVGAGGKIKSAFEILPELADSFQKLSKTESFAFGKKLGLDQGTILLLQQGRVAVEELVLRQKQLGVATKEDAAAAAEFNDALADSQQTFANLFTSAGTTILPLLTTMMKGFDALAGWIKGNSTLVTGFFIGVAGILAAKYIPAMFKAAIANKVFLLSMGKLLLIGGGLVALAAGFALLYEDVVAFLNGQESFIGDLAKKYQWFGDIVKGVLGGIKKSFEVLSELFDDIMNSIPDIANAFSNALDDTKSFFGFGDDEISANLEKALSVTNSIDNNPLNGQTSASIVNSQQSSSRVNNVNVGSTTVNTQATDAAGVASAVGDNLNNQISMAIQQFDDAEAF